MYVYTYAHGCVCLYNYTHLRVYVYVHVNLYTYVHVYSYTYSNIAPTCALACFLHAHLLSKSLGLLCQPSRTA